MLNPKGLISHDQTRLMFLTVAILFCVAIPSVALLFFTAWKYRETNNKAEYAPESRHSKLFIAGIWLIPSSVMLVMAFILWNATHRLVPQDPIASSAKPLVIQVVSMRWKWLFIYPEQNIATVNYVQLPLHRPVEFDLTADESPMSSFWIPNLGGQLYAMTGMENKLHLMADTPGDFPGSTAELNGDGYTAMNFTAHAASSEDFDNWVHGIKQGNTVLDDSSYKILLKPSENNPHAYYASAETGLYDKVLMKYMEPAKNNKQMDDMQMMGMADQ